MTRLTSFPTSYCGNGLRTKARVWPHFLSVSLRCPLLLPPVPHQHLACSRLPQDGGFSATGPQWKSRLCATKEAPADRKLGSFGSWLSSQCLMQSKGNTDDYLFSDWKRQSPGCPLLWTQGGQEGTVKPKLGNVIKPGKENESCGPGGCVSWWREETGAEAISQTH